MYAIPENLDEYALLHSSREDPLLNELAAVTRARTERPHMITGHVEGSFLRLLVQTTGSKNVLDVGTFTGYSALSMAMGLAEGGRVITCDVDPVATQIARDYWVRSPHGKKIELRLAPALETIKTLDGLFDLVFIDADKPNYIAYWEAALPKVRSGGLVLVDNVLWDGKVLDPKDQSDHLMVAFNQHVRYDHRVDLVMLTIRDGVTMARKK